MDALWYFNGKRLNANDNEGYNGLIIPRMLSSNLILESITPEDEGKYECTFEGETKEVYILVIPGIQSLFLLMDYYVICLDHKFDLNGQDDCRSHY